MEARPHQRLYFEMAAMLLATLLVALTLTACWGRVSEKGNVTMGISNCKQIITCLRMYASDHDGFYPDSKIHTVRFSNEVFHELFVAGILTNQHEEKIFGCPLSAFEPDRYIGGPPDFTRAVEAGENHWAMTRGVNDSLSGSIPLVFESPAVPVWPPLWNADAANKPVKGRTWKGGKIIIGQNDSSISLYSLKSATGNAVGLVAGANGKDLFEAAIYPEKFPGGVILDVAQ